MEYWQFSQNIQDHNEMNDINLNADISNVSPWLFDQEQDRAAQLLQCPEFLLRDELENFDVLVG